MNPTTGKAATLQTATEFKSTAQPAAIARTALAAARPSTVRPCMQKHTTRCASCWTFEKAHCLAKRIALQSGRPKHRVRVGHSER